MSLIAAVLLVALPAAPSPSPTPSPQARPEIAAEVGRGLHAYNAQDLAYYDPPSRRTPSTSPTTAPSSPERSA